MMTLASAGVFAVRFPTSPVTAEFKRVIERVLA
jgi:hypothetical protein